MAHRDNGRSDGVAGSSAVAGTRPPPPLDSVDSSAVSRDQSPASCPPCCFLHSLTLAFLPVPRSLTPWPAVVQGTKEGRKTRKTAPLGGRVFPRAAAAARADGWTPAPRTPTHHRQAATCQLSEMPQASVVIPFTRTVLQAMKEYIRQLTAEWLAGFPGKPASHSADAPPQTPRRACRCFGCASQGRRNNTLGGGGLLRKRPSNK